MKDFTRNILCAVTALALTVSLAGSALCGAAAAEEAGAAEEPVSVLDEVLIRADYSVSDEEAVAAADTVVAEKGTRQLTNSQLNVFYWLQVNNFMNSYSYYLSYIGLDYTQPLNAQACYFDSSITWQQYFLTEALDYWQSYAAMSEEADSIGFELPEEAQSVLDSMAELTETNAVEAGYESAEAYLTSRLGASAGMDAFVNFYSLYYKANCLYNDKYHSVAPTDEELEAYFDQHADEYAESGLTKDTTYVNVRHILLLPEGATTATATSQEWPEEAWTASEEQAAQILADFLAGEAATEEAFAELANTWSADPGSNTNGGLYEDVTEGQMVDTFNDWCFDAERQTGDTGIVKTSYGYHIMYFVSSRPAWTETALEDMQSEIASAYAAEVADRTGLTVDWDAIALGEVSFT